MNVLERVPTDRRGQVGALVGAAFVWWLAFWVNARIWDWLLYDLFGMDPEARLTETLHFFLYDTVKITLLLCGIIVPRDVLPDWLQWISNVLPASYALEALQQVGAYPDLTAIALRDIIVVIGFAVLALCLAAATLRRRTP